MRGGTLVLTLSMLLLATGCGASPGASPKPSTVGVVLTGKWTGTLQHWVAGGNLSLSGTTISQGPGGVLTMKIHDFGAWRGHLRGDQVVLTSTHGIGPGHTASERWQGTVHGRKITGYYTSSVLTNGKVAQKKVEPFFLQRVGP